MNENSLPTEFAEPRKIKKLLPVRFADVKTAAEARDAGIAPHSLLEQTTGKNEDAESILSVRESDVQGRGVFTNIFIREGTEIIEYTGEKISNKIADIREIAYKERGIACYLFRLSKSTIIDATETGGIAKYINHSCEPNCKTRIDHRIHCKPRIIVFAKRHIHAGEELTFDYCFDEEMEDVIMCSCGSSACRGVLN